MANPPILSICIPTYNRADLLDLCLATVLPQVAEHSERVEVVIRDNASPDHTAEVIDRYEKDYSLSRHRNVVNLGGLVNVLDIVFKQASGEYIWLIGDDDTLNHGAVAHLLRFLDELEEPLPDVVGINVAYLPESERPPLKDGRGGITAESDHLMRQQGNDERLATLDDLFEAPSADFTAMYGFLLRRSIWVETLGDWEPPSGNPFVSVTGTYPHACAVALAYPGISAAVIRTPLVTIYELQPEDFLWARHHPLNTLLWASELHALFERRGISRETLAPFRQLQLWRARRRLPKMIRDDRYAGGWKEGLQFLRVTPGIRVSLSYLLLRIAFFHDANENALTRFTDSVKRGARRSLTYFTRDCRPARWYRNRGAP